MYNFFIGFLAGVALGQAWTLTLTLTLFFGLWSFVPISSRAINLKFCLFFLALTLGILSIINAQGSIIITLPESNERGEVSIEGVVTDEPDERDLNTRLTFQPTGSEGKILLVVSTFPTYQYGDLLRVTGKLEKPKTFETDDNSGRTFNYPAYLAVRGIGAIMYQPRVKRLEGGGGFRFVSKLFQLKHAFLTHLDQALPEPESSLLGGLVVGGKRSLGDLWQERLRRAGLVHLVVLSGYNLTIVGAAIAGLFSYFRLRRSLALALSALAIIIFAIMVGGGASVIRAAVMALIVIIARLTGRIYEAGRALAAAVLLMVIINPLILLNDIGFQLSCLATAGLIYGEPLFERWFHFMPKRFGFRSTVATTVAAQVAVLPLILYSMGQLPPYALLTNVLVVPIVPLAMLLSAGIGLAGFIFSPLAYLIAPLGYLLAKYILIVTLIGSALPGASLMVKSFSVLLVVVIYAGYYLVWKKEVARQQNVRPQVDSMVGDHSESGQ